MDRFIIGIDPGLKGGVSILNTEKKTLYSVNTPVYEGDAKTEYDIHAMAHLFSMRPETVHMVYLERVGARPGQGVTSMFRFGWGYGLWQGIIVARGMPFTLVTPQKWKKLFGLNDDKEASRQKASELYPSCTHFWKRKKDDGVAESALLAHYGALEANLPVGHIQPVHAVEKRELLLG